MSSATTVSVNWGKASLADKPPVYADDGSAWSNGYRGVWHFRPMNEVGVLTIHPITGITPWTNLVSLNPLP